MRRIFLVFLLTAFASEIKSQNVYISDTLYFNISTGIQMSGIKKEDFVMHNYAPYVSAGIGRKFSSEIAVEFGYDGFYFNTIANDDRREYSFLFGKVRLDLMKILSISNFGQVGLSGYLGSGYFYNHYYQRPNVCATFGLMYNNLFLGKWQISCGLSSILGWDIYQNNEDILPRMEVGLTYKF